MADLVVMVTRPLKVQHVAQCRQDTSEAEVLTLRRNWMYSDIIDMYSVSEGFEVTVPGSAS